MNSESLHGRIVTRHKSMTSRSYVRRCAAHLQSESSGQRRTCQPEMLVGEGTKGLKPALVMAFLKPKRLITSATKRKSTMTSHRAKV